MRSLIKLFKHNLSFRERNIKKIYYNIKLSDKFNIKLKLKKNSKHIMRMFKS